MTVDTKLSKNIPDPAQKGPTERDLAILERHERWKVDFERRKAAIAAKGEPPVRAAE